MSSVFCNGFQDLCPDLFSEDFRISKDISKLKPIIDKHKLPIGERKYENLGLEEFKRIIFIFVESLSQDLIHCYNAEIGLEVTPFLCSDNVRSSTFINMKTSATPTLQALTAIFASHPNYNIQKPTGDKNSFQKVLKQAGYKNLFIRSASKFYADENIVFKKWGYDHIESREDFFKRPELQKYIYGWGLEDRILYDETVKRLKRYKDDKVFVTLLGVDTHPLHGQIDFKYLTYPKLPVGFRKRFKMASRFMQAVHHTDFDLGRFVEMLKKEDLYNKETLIIISGDHSCPPNAVTRHIPGHTKRSLGNLTLSLLTPQRLPKVDLSRPSSQLDIAPTLLHMMNLDVPKGYWGQSLFAKNRNNPTVGYHKDIVQLEYTDTRVFFNMKKRESDQEKQFFRLFSTVFVD